MSDYIKPMFAAIAATVTAYQNCVESENREWLQRHSENLQRFTDELPHGSGFDCGSMIVVEKCTDKRLVLSTSFHHMDENGCYDGWTEHEVIVTPSLSLGFELRVTGRNHRDIKEYIIQSFDACLGADWNITQGKYQSDVEMLQRLKEQKQIS